MDGFFWESGVQRSVKACLWVPRASQSLRYRAPRWRTWPQSRAIKISECCLEKQPGSRSRIEYCWQFPSSRIREVFSLCNFSRWRLTLGRWIGLVILCTCKLKDILPDQLSASGVAYEFSSTVQSHRTSNTFHHFQHSEGITMAWVGRLCPPLENNQFVKSLICNIVQVIICSTN